MIILCENKKNVKLIKDFLLEATSDEDKMFNASVNIPAFRDEMDTVVDLEAFQDEEDAVTEMTPVTVKQIEKVSKSKPKLAKLKNLLAVGITVPVIAASLMFSGKSDKEAIEKIAQVNNIPAQKVVQQLKKPTVKKLSSKISFKDKKISLKPSETSLSAAIKKYEYAGKGVTDKHVNSLYNFEGFRAKPYNDEKGLSVGYGIQLFKNRNNRGGKTWQEVFFIDKLGETSKDGKTIVRNGKKTKLKSIKTITKNEARKASKIDLAKRISKINNRYKWLEKLPGEIQLAFLDLTYNMGINFNMKAVKANLKAAAEVIEEGDASSFKMATGYIQNAIKNLMYHTPKDELEYKNPEKSKKEIEDSLYFTAYSMGKKEKTAYSSSKNIHRRAQRAVNLMNSGIAVINKKISLKENNSLISVYSHLYS